MLFKILYELIIYETIKSRFKKIKDFIVNIFYTKKH